MSCRSTIGLILVLFYVIQLPHEEKIEPPIYIQNEAVLAVVQSMARILAAYFSNTSMFVYPAHCPKVLPPVHREYTVDSRVMPLFHDLVSLVVREDGLGDVWTADHTLEYPLLSGLLPGAVWFARSLRRLEGSLHTGRGVPTSCAQVCQRL